MEISGAPSTKKIRDPVSPNMNKLEESVEADLKKSYSFSQTCCIYRVPERLRHLNESAYTPQVVSIGPFHHGEEKLEAMEDHKRMYLQEFVELSKVSVKDLVKIVEKNEARLRDCYAETIELSSEDFIKMILMDAIFIIMVMLKYCYLVRRSNDRIFYRPWKFEEVSSDICLLENQLPFFILEELCKKVNVVNMNRNESVMINTNHYESVMIMVTYMCLKDRWYSWVTEDILVKINSSQLEHFVHFLEICQRPTEPQRRNESGALVIAPRTATQLQEAGVKFGVRPGSCLLDIKFSAGTLEIPQLEVQDPTEVLLRNLQAYEQSHCDNKYINDYICFMGYLVNTPKDVDVLIEKDIMKRVLSNNKKVTDLLHNLCKEAVVSGHFSGLCEDLNAYSRTRWPQWKANLKNVYFKNPCTTISVIAAAILLILTVIQTGCSIIQVRKQ